MQAVDLHARNVDATKVLSAATCLAFPLIIDLLPKILDGL